MDEQNATLERALEALRAICRPAPPGNADQSAAVLPPSADFVSRDAGTGYIPPHDPAEWRKPFALWLNSACARHRRFFGGVTALHRTYCEWEIAGAGVPCSRETFETLLAEMGFLLGEIEGVTLVSGLTFRDDVEAVESWPAEPAAMWEGPRQGGKGQVNE